MVDTNNRRNYCIKRCEKEKHYFSGRCFSLFSSLFLFFLLLFHLISRMAVVQAKHRKQQHGLCAFQNILFASLSIVDSSCFSSAYFLLTLVVVVVVVFWCCCVSVSYSTAPEYMHSNINTNTHTLHIHIHRHRQRHRQTDKGKERTVIHSSFTCIYIVMPFTL